MFAKVDYIMVNVSDMDRSVKFYRDQLGMPIRFEMEGWTEFETGATTLALHQGGPSHSGSREAKSSGTCTFGFYVDDLDETCRELESRGVSFLMRPTDKETEGIKLAIIADPDGLPISVAQPLHVTDSE